MKNTTFILNNYLLFFINDTLKFQNSNIFVVDKHL